MAAATLPPRVASPLASLPVQSRHTLRADGTVRVETFVRCPRSSGWVALGRCRACDTCAHVSEGSMPVVVCATPAAPRDGDSVGAFLAPAVWCIEAEAPARLGAQMPQSEMDAVVTDGDGHAIGLLSRSAAASARADTPARACMDPVAVLLFESASAERALALAGPGGVKTLPVVSGGRVVGRVDLTALAAAGTSRE